MQRTRHLAPRDSPLQDLPTFNASPQSLLTDKLQFFHEFAALAQLAQSPQSKMKKTPNFEWFLFIFSSVLGTQPLLRSRISLLRPLLFLFRFSLSSFSITSVWEPSKTITDASFSNPWAHKGRLLVIDGLFYNLYRNATQPERLCRLMKKI